MDKLASILVGVDFTPCAAAAFRQAVRLAGWNRSTLRAVHVIDTVVSIDRNEELSALQRSIQDGLVRDAKRGWEAFLPSDPAKASVPLEVVIGNETQSMLRAVLDHRADLLVMGIHGSGSATGSGKGAASSGGDYGIGELAKACVRSAPCRVLLVDDAKQGAFKTIVVGVDFSKTSLAALETAMRVAAQDDAALHVVHVFYPPWNRLMTPSEASTPAFQAKYREVLRTELEETVEKLGPAASYANARCHLVEHSSDGRGLAEFARSIGADLMVMGTRGRTNFAETLLGSTAERVLRYAPCSILTVRAR